MDSVTYDQDVIREVACQTHYPILEKQLPELDIVLVRADTSDEVRIAFRNYFSDARDFIQLLDDGCARLGSQNC